MPTIYPSLMNIDILNLQREIERLDPHVHGYQLDIMDGRFVPNMSCGTNYINAIAGITYKKLWIHLMVENPHDWIDKMVLPAQSIISFHFESNSGIDKMINSIQDKNWLPSIAINPKTPVEKIFPYLPMVYQILIMSVNPGSSGQAFLSETYDKIGELVGYRQTANLPFRIGVDGGLTGDILIKLVKMGANDFAMSSAIFNADDPVAAIEDLNLRMALQSE